MEPAHQEYLARRLKMAFFARDEIITGPEQGIAEHYYIIKQGRVRGETAPGEISETAWELVPGESFPIGALLARRPARTYHRAVEDTFCFELHRSDFEELLGLSPVFRDFCTRRIANMLDQAMREAQATTATTVSEDRSLNAPLANLLNVNPISCTVDTPIREALQQIDHAQRRSIAIVDDGELPIGIFTLRDVMVRVTLPQVSIDTPISEVMTPITMTLPQTAFAYEAALQMAESGIGHVCVVDDKGRFKGLVSERDLFSLQRVGLGNVSRGISHADSIDTLKILARDIQQLIQQMMAQGASVTQLTQIITTLNDHLTRRVILLCEAELGKPDIPYIWLAFGSEGRLEQTLNTDQDNGMIFEPPSGKSAEQCREVLLPLAERINHALAEIGFPLCPGNIMASNPECCLSLQEWQQRFTRWIEQGSPQHLLNASIFFDFRALDEDAELAVQLRNFVADKIRKQPRFLRMMTANALNNRPPLGLFGDIVVSKNDKRPDDTIDLKLQGLTPFVDSARILALANGVKETNTIQRLLACADAGAIPRHEAEAWKEAYSFIQYLRMRHHYEQLRQHQAPDNHINPDHLNELDRRILKEAFRQARKLQTRLSLDYHL